MREEDLRTEVRLRIDRRLSALEEDPFLARRILALEKGREKRMKKNTVTQSSVREIRLCR